MTVWIVEIRIIDVLLNLYISYSISLSVFFFKAIEYYIKAIDVQKQLSDEVELADSLHNLGVLYMKTGKHQQALDLCSKSLKVPPCTTMCTDYNLFVFG